MNAQDILCKMRQLGAPRLADQAGVSPSFAYRALRYTNPDPPSPRLLLAFCILAETVLKETVDPEEVFSEFPTANYTAALQNQWQGRPKRGREKDLSERVQDELKTVNLLKLTHDLQYAFKRGYDLCFTAGVISSSMSLYELTKKFPGIYGSSFFEACDTLVELYALTTPAEKIMDLLTATVFPTMRKLMSEHGKGNDWKARLLGREADALKIAAAKDPGKLQDVYQHLVSVEEILTAPDKRLEDYFRVGLTYYANRKDEAGFLEFEQKTRTYLQEGHSEARLTTVALVYETLATSNLELWKATKKDRYGTSTLEYLPLAIRSIDDAHEKGEVFLGREWRAKGRLELYVVDQGLRPALADFESKAENLINLANSSGDLRLAAQVREMLNHR